MHNSRYQLDLQLIRFSDIRIGCNVFFLNVESLIFSAISIIYPIQSPANEVPINQCITYFNEDILTCLLPRCRLCHDWHFCQILMFSDMLQIIRVRAIMCELHQCGSPFFLHTTRYLWNRKFPGSSLSWWIPERSPGLLLLFQVDQGFKGI